MEDKQNENDPKQEDIEMKEMDKGLRRQMKDADRKAILREAVDEAFKEYDDVFKKLSKS